MYFTVRITGGKEIDLELHGRGRALSAKQKGLKPLKSENKKPLRIRHRTT
jgi:hypothetical protein